MAWNGSPGYSKRKTAPVSHRIHIRYIFIGLIASIVVFLTLFIAFQNKEPEPSIAKEKPKTKIIADFKPTTNKVKILKPRKKWPKAWKVPENWDKPYPPQAYREDGTLKQHSRYVKVITNRIDQMHRSLPEKVFRNGAEQHIGLLLSIEPGKLVVGEMKYGPNFVKKFLRSLETPIVITKDDTPEIAALKKAVIETKIELKDRYDAGEDIAEIMNQTRRELVELGVYRKEIDDMVRSIRREKGRELTAEDYQDIVNAANIMLNNRGCAPLKNQDLIIQKLKLHEQTLKKDMR